MRVRRMGGLLQEPLDFHTGGHLRGRGLCAASVPETKIVSLL